MASRKIATVTSAMTSLTARIYRLPDTDEYKVVFYSATGERLPDADYFTTDLEDARGTAQFQCDNPPALFL